MKICLIKVLGSACIILLLFVIFGVTFGTLFVTGIIGFIVSFVYIITLSKRLNTKFIRTIKNIYIVGSICFLVSFVLIESLVLIHMSDESLNKKINYVVVLGAGLHGDQVSKRLEGRLEKALEYIRNHNEAKIIVSGGQGEDELISEAAAMKNYLILKGVDKKKIILEDKSTSTIENIKYTTKLLKQKNESNPVILLVTSDYHLFRAKMIADTFEMNSIGAASESPFFVRVNYMIREYFTVMKDWMYINIIERGN